MPRVVRNIRTYVIKTPCCGHDPRVLWRIVVTDKNFLEKNGQKGLTVVSIYVIICVSVILKEVSDVFLSGRYNHQVDDKGRIRIPAKFKDALGSNPYMTVGQNRCLYIFSREEAERILGERFGEVDGFTKDGRLSAMRKIFSRGTFLEEDKQGRLTVPSWLIEYSGIKKNVVSIGMNNRVELWDEETWNKYDAAEDADSLFGED